LINLSFGQNKAIQITNNHLTKSVVIKENRRIKIKMVNGQTYTGYFKVIDDEKIKIKNAEVEIANILEIRKKPLLISTVLGVTFVYFGFVAVGVGIFVGVILDAAAFLLVPVGVAVFYAGIRTPNFYKNYKNSQDFVLQIIDLDNLNSETVLNGIPN
jgi:hypothetical protein